MNKNTQRAIQRRLDAGMTEFAIGEKYYFTKKNTLLSEYSDGYGYSGGPMIEGIVVDGVFDPDNMFTPEEKAALTAKRR